MNYVKVGKTLFGENKCLIVAEKLDCNAHVHMQGFTSLTDNSLEETITKLSSEHFQVRAWEAEKLRLKEGDKVRGRPRPIKRSRKEVDELGFQYLCKEDHPPLFMQGFTQDEIMSLRGKSAEHVDKLKNGLKEYLHAIEYPTTPERALKRMRLDALEYYEKEDKRPRPAFQKDVLWSMWNHPQRNDSWKEFVSERM